MDYKVLYRKYRPKNFDELVGQDSIKDILVNSITSNKIAHAYIFTGLRGTGKTSTAKIFAKTLNCLNNSSGISCDKCEMCINYNESADIIEIDAASNNGVEEIRSLRDSVKIAPYNSKYKVYIIDEVHMLSNSAWNAFLKTLEEPPSHVIFILATTEINKIPDTVKSRCQIFSFNKITNDIMFERLNDICKKEKIKIEEAAIIEIVKLARGSLRDALSYLDKVSKFNEKITVSIIENNFGVLNEKKLNDLYYDIKKGLINSINDKIEEISNLGITPLNFINDFIDFLLNKIISKEATSLNEINLIKEILNSLNSIISKFNSVLNPFILIKIELMTINYFPGNNLENSKSLIIEETNQNKSSIESSIAIEPIKNAEENSVNVIKSIRINNSFVNASKNNKEEFNKVWNLYLENLNLADELSLLGYVEGANAEVVSNTNVLFSFKTGNEALVFNKNVILIENVFNEKNKTRYKFVALSTKEWNEEKKKYIENKNKKYEFINEDEIKKDNNSLASDLASNIFGEKLVEFR